MDAVGVILKNVMFVGKCVINLFIHQFLDYSFCQQMFYYKKRHSGSWNWKSRKTDFYYCFLRVNQILLEVRE